jgi:hypothetical protein
LQGDRDRGSVTAYLLIMSVALIVLAGLVLDGGAALAAHGKAADTAQQAARAAPTPSTNIHSAPAPRPGSPRTPVPPGPRQPRCSPPPT